MTIYLQQDFGARFHHESWYSQMTQVIELVSLEAFEAMRRRARDDVTWRAAREAAREVKGPLRWEAGSHFASMYRVDSLVQTRRGPLVQPDERRFSGSALEHRPT